MSRGSREASQSIATSRSEPWVSSAAMRFEKWHGIGNAYLVMEQNDLPMEAGAARVRRICHPDLGAGGDGILLIGDGDAGRRHVRIFNPDGGEAEFSGN